MRILVFGDSISQGYYDLETGGWVNLLFLDIMKRKARQTDFTTELFNNSVSGDSTRQIIARLEAEVQYRQWEDESIMLIFAVGMNDTRIDNGVPFSTPATYQAELEALYTKAKACAEQIVFVGLGTVDEAESAPWKFNTGTHELVWKNDRIQLFDTVLKAFAKAKSATYIPVFDTFIDQQQQGVSLHTDGLHLNAAGHKLIYEKVKVQLGIPL